MLHPESARRARAPGTPEVTRDPDAVHGDENTVIWVILTKF
jgi:hypothetical protein